MFKQWSGDLKSNSVVLTVASMQSNTAVEAEFGNELQVRGWRWAWDIECNCDIEEKRMHFQDEVATYKYVPGTLLDHDGSVV